MRLAAAALAFLALAAPAAARPGDFDRTFAHHGRIAFAGGQGYSEISDAALDRSGRILLAGTSQGGALGGPWAPGPVVARLTAGGRLDRRFGTGGRSTIAGGPDYLFRSPVRIAALPGNGAVLAAELRYFVQPQQIAVHLLGPNGAHTSALTLTPGERWEVGGVGVDGARRIVVAASRFDRNTFTGLVVRLQPNGAIDPAYARAALPLGAVATALLVNRDGSAYVALHRDASTGNRPREYVYALDSGGRARLLASFSLHDRVGDVTGTTALARGPRGTLLAAGNDIVHSRRVGWVRRLGGRKFHVRVAQTIHAIARDRHGRIVLAGAWEGDLGHAAVTRLTPDGRADRRFGRRGVRILQLGVRPRTHLISSDARAVLIDARGRIVLAGVAYDDNAMDREDLGRSYFAVARLKG